MFRAKAGGRQSSKDASGKHAQSGGAALRRYNEVQPCECLMHWCKLLLLAQGLGSG